jgi:hypothetical protein
MAKPNGPRPPTLAELTGERPFCRYCGKDLKPRNERVEVPSLLGVVGERIWHLLRARHDAARSGRSTLTGQRKTPVVPRTLGAAGTLFNE